MRRKAALWALGWGLIALVIGGAWLTLTIIARNWR